MQAASSAEPAIAVPVGIRAAMVAIGWIPAAQVLLAALPVVFSVSRGDWRWSIATPALLYLLPPLLVRAGTWSQPLPNGRVELASIPFLRWWASAQCQIVFARLPWLEEALRLMPGLYSAWLRLWGAKVGSLVYWSPGVVILDRSLVRIGDRVAFGTGVRVSPHVIAPGSDGRGVLLVAPVSIGADSLVGAFSILLPGSEIAIGEVTPPFRSLHPFSRFEGGRRIRVPHAPPANHAEDADAR